jgi:hypothetical protein
MTDFDSRVDTYEHIMKVQHYLVFCVDNFMARMLLHDRSKLTGMEKEAFDIATPRLANVEYGSDEYRATLREIKPAIQQHYALNSHHPEHYADGINGMNLFDLLEMLCDWKAASERTGSTGNMTKSLEYNKTRFNISDQLASILENTAKEFGWF